MSVILDALKKLEQEKQNRAPGPVKVRTESLLRGIDGPRRTRGWVVPAVILAVAAALGTSVYIIKGDKKTAPEQAVAGAPAARSAEEVSAPRSTPAVPTPVPQEAPPAATSSAALPPAEVRNEAAPARAEAAPVARMQGEKRQRTSSRSPLRSPETSRRAAAPVSQETPSDIMVSGIAWQESRSDRRAVVNGGLYAEGATVGGAAIVQIHQDRVRFNRDGRIFDVPLATPFPAR